MCQSHLLIGAASSGSGKTTFTLGLLRALKNRSFKVQPFKCGPDYIDTRHHRMAAGNPSVNLDLFMMSEAHVRDLYAGLCNMLSGRDVLIDIYPWFAIDPILFALPLSTIAMVLTSLITYKKQEIRRY